MSAPSRTVLGRLAAAALVLFILGFTQAAAARIPSQPTPSGPVYAGVPGALPPRFHYVYTSPSRGWPVLPRSVQHPIRGSFIDPRGTDDNGLSGYHFGIDINVDDAHPDRGAPPGLSHRVYALDSGVMSAPANVLARRCVNRRADVGHFSYWHVSPIVQPGRRVRAGEQIGWTCLGVWHVHVSEWQVFKAVRVWVNPLHRRGLIVPYTDSAAPRIAELRFFTPAAQPWRPMTSLAQPDTATPLPANGLHGSVELRAHVADPQSFLGFLTRNPAWPSQFTPYRVSVEIRNARSGRPVMKRVSFQADQMPQTPYLVHYAPGTVEDDNMQECVGPPQLPKCDGTSWFRPFSRFGHEYWNTHTVANGDYLVTVRAYDLAGNVSSKSIVATIKN